MWAVEHHLTAGGSDEACLLFVNNLTENAIIKIVNKELVN